MSNWAEVDGFLNRTLVKPDDALLAAVENTRAAGMPAIEVTAGQGKLLMLLARIHGARRVLEIGTLGGFSTIWLARGIPEDASLTPASTSRRTRRWHAAIWRRPASGIK